MNTSKCLLAAGAVVLLAGCVSAKATMLTSQRYAPVPEENVSVYLEESEVPSSCERIALIHASGDASTTDESQMISAARRRAGKIGANGVLLGTVRDPSTGTRVASAVFGITAERKGEMVAYRCEGAESAATGPQVD